MTKPMTPERKQEIKARCEAATKMSDPCKHPGCHSHLTHPCEGCGRQGGFASWRTLLGIVRQDLTDCLDEIERLRGELRRFEFIFSNKRSKPFRLLHDIARKALEGTNDPD